MNNQNVVKKKYVSMLGILRIYALLTSTINLSALFNMAFLDMNFFTNKPLPFALFKLTGCSAFFICMVILFIKPNLWKLFVIGHLFDGIIVIIGGEPLFGSLRFFIGCVMAIRHGMMQKHSYAKIFTATVFLTIANLLNLFLSEPFNLSHTIFTSGTFFGYALLFFILLKYLTQVKPEEHQAELEASPEKKMVFLSDYNFTPNELYAIAAILRNESYAAIAVHLAVSESVIKKMMLLIYKKFGCKGKELFLHKIAQCTIVYPD